MAANAFIDEDLAKKRFRKSPEWHSTVCVLFLLLGALSRGAEEEDDEVGTDELGGVSIKVFRGPSRTKGQETFAPFGYHVKMPAGGAHHKKAEGDSDEPDEEDEDSSKQGGDEEDFDFPDDEDEN